jgi:uroporphyrinogen decarboxylase
VETVFLPIMVAEYLCDSPAALLDDIQRTPELVHQGLATITETFTQFLPRCLEAGVDGFFFATTWATPTRLSAQQYQDFGRPYDLRLLEAARAAGATINVLHVCGDGARVLEFTDYPAQLLSYAATSSANPGLAEITQRVRGAVIGGLSPEAVTSSDPRQAREEATRGLAATGGRRWVLGGACSLPTTSQENALRAAAESVGISHAP